MKEPKEKKWVNPWEHLLPDSSELINQENLDLFFETMFERQEIWYKRFILKQERPWTENKFFKDYKFTNVYRELDRNSQWMIQNILLKETNRKELIWKMMLFRFFNNPETFEYIGNINAKSFKGKLPSYEQYNQSEFEDLILSYRETGSNPYTSAYLINSMACPGQTRDYCYLKKVIPTLHEAIPKINKLLLTAKKPEEIINFLKTMPACADFIAHEFYQDFTYAPRYSQVNLMKFDQNDFTNVGPGASVGIRLIFPSLKGKEQLEAIYILRDLANAKLAELGKFKYLNWSSEKKEYFITKGVGNLTLHAIEMYLCEFQKYWKMVKGVGKQRSKFIAKTEV